MKSIILSALFLPLVLSAQLNPNIHNAMLAQFGAGALDGLNQTLNYHYTAFKKQYPRAKDRYWNPQESWKNKYRNWPEDPRPKYLGATTFLAWTTDAHHMTRTLGRGFDAGTVFIYARGMKKKQKKKKWFWYAADFGLLFAARSAGFHLVYSGIFK